MWKMLVNSQDKVLAVNNLALTIDVGNLPPGYTELQYVYNGSSTYIDTGLRPTVDDVILELKCQPSAGSWYIFQSRRTSSGTLWGISGSTSGNKINMGINGSTVVSGISRDTDHIYTVRATYRNGNGTLYVKDETTGTSDTQTFTYTYADFPVNTYLFGNYGGNRVAEGNKIHYAKATVNGSIVLDYVPVTYNGTAGFYDRANDRFVGASGGTLNAGPAVE